MDEMDELIPLLELLKLKQLYRLRANIECIIKTQEEKLELSEMDKAKLIHQSIVKKYPVMEE